MKLYAYKFMPGEDKELSCEVVEATEKTASYKPETGTAKYLKSDEGKIIRRSNGAYTYFSLEDDRAKAVALFKERLDVEIQAAKEKYDALVVAKDILQ